MVVGAEFRRLFEGIRGAFKRLHGQQLPSEGFPGAPAIGLDRDCLAKGIDRFPRIGLCGQCPAKGEVRLPVVRDHGDDLCRSILRLGKPLQSFKRNGEVEPGSREVPFDLGSPGEGIHGPGMVVT